MSRYRKVRSCGARDFALASAARNIALSGVRVSDARIALGGMAPAPWHAEGLPLEHNGAKV